MADGVIFSEQAFRELQEKLRRVERLAVNLSQRFNGLTLPPGSERESTLLAQANENVNAAGDDQAGSGEFAACTMDDDGNLETTQRNETAWVLPGVRIANGQFVLLEREFRKGRWIARPALFAGGVARLTSSMTAASGTSTRTFGTGTANTYRNSGGTSLLVESSVTILNSTAQTAITDAWIQYKVDAWGTLWWDVGDC